MSTPRDDRQKDLFRPALDEIVDPGDPLVRPGREIDWGFLVGTGPGSDLSYLLWTRSVESAINDEMVPASRPCGAG